MQCILVERAGFEPTRNETTSGLQPGALPNGRSLPEMHYLLNS